MEEDDPHWRVVARAIEYWVVGALVAGSWVYGLYCGVRTLLG